MQSNLQLVFDLAASCLTKPAETIPETGPIREAFDFANCRGAELPECYNLPYAVESTSASEVRWLDIEDFKDLPDGDGPIFRVLCEGEAPMSNWSPHEAKALQIAESFNVRHFRFIGMSANPKNPVRV